MRPDQFIIIIDDNRKSMKKNNNCNEKIVWK